MDITFVNKIPLKEAYGVLCAPVQSASLKPALNSTFCQVLPKGATNRHFHFEPEIFFITKGQGQIDVGEESQIVSVGDLIQIPPHTPHTIHNIGTEPLEFLSVYSEDYEVPSLPKNVLVTAAPPTPNGPLHLGHISGPYLSSDVLTRYMRLQSSQVTSHSGTDDHQNYVSERARSLKINEDVFQKEQRGRILSGLKAMNIAFDEFIEPKVHHQYQHKILNFVQRALDLGAIERESDTVPYCASCEISLIDALAEGACPECRSPSHGCCESCGLVSPPKYLLNIRCGRCGKAATFKNEEVYVFNISRYFHLIEDELNALSVPPRLKNLIMLVKGKKNYKVQVSHSGQGKLGLKMPNSDQKIHVWFEMAAHYESFALRPETWIHFFGFDNSFYYLIFIPALLKAVNPNTRMPDAVITNEFLLLESRKFSTSRQHAVWADEFDGNSDHLRLFLMANRPSFQETNFSMNEFITFSDKLSAQLALITHRGHQIASENGKPSADAEHDVQRFLREMAYFMSPITLDLRQAASRILVFMDHTIHRFGHSANDRLRIQNIVKQLKPFMPTTEIL